MQTRWIKPVAFLLVTACVAAADPEFQSIFDGTNRGWQLNSGGDLPPKNVQKDGINPCKSGGYVVMHEKPAGDFVLDFDYKISKGCNSGVFLRVIDPKDPVYTGLEIAIDDTTGTGLHDTGAFYDLKAPKVNKQKPAGEWNHMTITAKGPKITVKVNGEDVSDIDLSQFTEPGKRPDGSTHKFEKLRAADLTKPGFFGFQDHGQDCWYKGIKIKYLD
jgi:hypothetical protein